MIALQKTQTRVALIALVLACGCAMKAPPSLGRGFVPMATLSKNDELPFHKVWYKPGVDWQQYHTIYVARVNTDYIQKLSWWKALGTGHRLNEDLPKLAAYTQQAFKQALKDDPSHRFVVLEDQKDDAHTIILEVALTEIVPSKVVLNALGYAPFVGAAARIIRGTSARSTVAFEALIRDASTDEPLAAFADREAEKFAPVNVQDLTWYGHARAIIKIWASQFVQVLNHKPGERIKESKPFTLKPW